MNNHIFQLIYDFLLESYGPQGWWPLINQKKKYHPLNYKLPNNDNEKYEVILGTILTQNTTWKQASLSLNYLHDLFNQKITPNNFLQADKVKIKQAIHYSGYYNQKFNYMENITDFFISLNGRTPLRNELLKVKGIGQETADSILLYAYHQPEFIVDAYTKRLFNYFKIIDTNDSYLKIKNYFHQNLTSDYRIFNEYHALIVIHGKTYYSKKPYGTNDPLINFLK